MIDAIEGMVSQRIHPNEEKDAEELIEASRICLKDFYRIIAQNVLKEGQNLDRKKPSLHYNKTKIMREALPQITI